MKLYAAAFISTLIAVPAFADHERHLGPLTAAIEGQLGGSWRASDEGDWFVLTNDVDEAEQSLLIDVGPPPSEGRITSINATILPEDDTAAIGFFADNKQTDAYCVAEITGAGEASFFCSQNGQQTSIARVAGAAKLDGSDLLTFVETPSAAEFYVNDAFIGSVSNHPAIGSRFGLLFYDRGTFALTAYQTGTQSGGTTTSAPQSELSSILGSLAPRVAEKEVAAGWTTRIENGWFVMENAAQDQATFGYTEQLGPPPEGGRATSTYVAMTEPVQGVWPNMTKSTVGLVMQNNDAKDFCFGEITGAGDAVMSCWGPNGGNEIGRLAGIVKFDGKDVLSLVEWPGVAQFWANNKMIGEVRNSPAQNGFVGIASYNIGTYWVAGYNVAPLVQGEDASSGGSEPEITDASAELGDGPLPMFDGDSQRITGTYLGVINGIFLHEFGHALIGELQLPATGPEEDSVDIFSALRISAPEAIQGETDEDKEINRLMATYATMQWFYSGLIAEQQGADVPWQDEHTADLKRFRNTFCVIYGSNPSYFSDLAAQTQMDERTLSRCNDEFAKQNRAWRSILAPHTRISAWYPDGLQSPDAPGAKLTAVFEPSNLKVGNLVKSIIGDSGSFQTYIDGLSQDYVLPRDITVTFKDCDMQNAWYSPNDGSITMCYEIVEWMVSVISDMEMGTSGGYPVSGSTKSAGNAGTGTGGEVVVASGAFDELADFGVPTTWALFSAPYNGPTPVEHPAATLVTTSELAGLLQNQSARFVLIDTRGQGQTIPSAFVEREAARDGVLTDGFQDIVAEWLEGQTGGDPNTYLIFFGDGPKDRSAYNAALRAGAIGKFTNVLWYRGGKEAWVANGLQLVDPGQ